MSARRAPVALLLGALLAIAAQSVLCWREGPGWVGLTMYGLALAVSLAELGSARRVPLRRPAWRFLLLAFAAGAVIWAAYLAHASQSYVAALMWWAAGAELAVVVLLKCGGRVRLSRGLRRDAAAMGLLFGVGLLLRLAGLGQFPNPMLGDEGSMALEAQRILNGDLLNPFGTGWFTHPNLFFYMEAAALLLLGRNLFALRLTAALLGALGVPAVYFLAKGVFGRKTAWVSGLFMAGWGLPLQLSRLALNNTADPLWGALALGFLQRGLVRGRRGWFVGAGLALGLSLYFYHGTRLLFLIVMAALVLSGAERLQRRWRGLLALALVALLVSGPLLVYYVQHPERFLARHLALSAVRMGEFAREQQSWGRASWLAPLWRLGRALSAFVYLRDRGSFYMADTPMLLPLSGGLFVLGVGSALRRWREIRHQVLLLWIGLTVILGGWMLNTPPHYQRYLIAVPAVCLMVGRAAVLVLRRVARWRSWPAPLRGRVAALAGLALVVINAAYYFGIYAPSGVFGDRNTKIADRTARLMVDLGSDYTTYFLGTPRMPLSGFNLVYFLAPDADWMELLGPPADWTFVRKDRGALFVLIPQRAHELPSLREQFPGGVEEAVEGRDGQLLFITYRLDSPASSSPMVEGAP